MVNAYLERAMQYKSTLCTTQKIKGSCGENSKLVQSPLNFNPSLT